MAACSRAAERVKCAFKKIDNAGTGKISKVSLANFLQHLDPSLTMRELASVIDNIAKTDDVDVDYNAFVTSIWDDASALEPPEEVAAYPITDDDLGLSSPPHSWNLQSVNSPLFAEYLDLCHVAGWGQRLRNANIQVGPGDALVVVDMQNDFVPTNEHNHYGALAVSEGDQISDLVVQLMNLFASKGALIVATRDYHPCDHCSFIDQGGNFPPHCVQGHPGSHFYQPIGNALRRLRMDPKNRVEVAFKGFHEHIDSFGSFQYPHCAATMERVSNIRNGPQCKELLHGCSLTAWTGCICLKCSNLDNDINAPPDVLAALRRTSLADNLNAQGIERVFACGLALDFCVLDTVRNARKAGFPNSFLVVDASRAVHIPGYGQFGTGFLQDPSLLMKFMIDDGVRLVPSSALLSGMVSENATLSRSTTLREFPEVLSAFRLVHVTECSLALDFNKLEYKASEPEAVLQILQLFGIDAIGKISPAMPVTLDAVNRERAGLPRNAVSFCWANPLIKIHTMNNTAISYFSTLNPCSSFFAFGGFIYFNEGGSICYITALAPGDGLRFATPQKWRPQYTKALSERGAFHPVTLPMLATKGAKRFAWIQAGEKLTVGNASTEPWLVAEHGAFVYLFGETEKEDTRDVFFPLEMVREITTEPSLKPLDRAKTVPGKAGISPQATYRKRVLNEHGIVFMNVHELEQDRLGESVHYKGFAARIDFDDSATKIEAERVLTMITRQNFDTLVWDGDDFRMDSFTKLIPDIYNATNVLLVMFLRDTEEERQRVEDSWNDMNLPIICFLCPPEVSFQELGAVALRETGSRRVVCFGGGAVVDDEVKHGSPDISYHFFGACRRSAGDPQVSEHSPLEEHVNSLTTNSASKVVSGCTKPKLAGQRSM